MDEWIFDSKVLVAGYKLVTWKDPKGRTFDTEDFEKVEDAQTECQVRFEAAAADPDKKVELPLDSSKRFEFTVFVKAPAEG